MTTETRSSNSALAFVLGGVVVVLAGLVWFIFAGGELPGQNDAETQINLPDGK